MRRVIVFSTLFLFSISVVSIVGISIAGNYNDLMREEILAAHNKYRAELKIPSLVWSEELATHAKEWALHLARSGGQLRHSKRQGEGENLWQGTAGHFSYTQMINSWGSEKKYFKYGTFPSISTSGNWADVGHYTQIIWRNTTKVGCAKTTSGRYDIFVCRYNPPGNYIGQKVY